MPCHEHTYNKPACNRNTHFPQLPHHLLPEPEPRPDRRLRSMFPYASGSGKTGDLVTHQRDALSGNFRDAGRFLLRLPGRSASFLETILRSRHRLRLFHRLHPRRRCLPRGGGRRRFRHPDSPSGSLGNDDHLPDLPAENHPKDPRSRRSSGKKIRCEENRRPVRRFHPHLLFFSLARRTGICQPGRPINLKTRLPRQIHPPPHPGCPRRNRILRIPRSPAAGRSHDRTYQPLWHRSQGRQLRLPLRTPPHRRLPRRYLD